MNPQLVPHYRIFQDSRLCNILQVCRNIYWQLCTSINQISLVICTGAMVRGNLYVEVEKLLNSRSNTYSTVLLFVYFRRTIYSWKQFSSCIFCMQLMIALTKSDFVTLAVPSNLLISSWGHNFVTPTANFCGHLAGLFQHFSKTNSPLNNFLFWCYFRPKRGLYDVF